MTLDKKGLEAAGKSLALRFGNAPNSWKWEGMSSEERNIWRSRAAAIVNSYLMASGEEPE